MQESIITVVFKTGSPPYQYHPIKSVKHFITATQTDLN